MGVKAHLFRARGSGEARVPFKAVLKREGEEDLCAEGVVTNEVKQVECFRFTVEADGSVTMGDGKTPMPAAKAKARAVRPMRAMQVMKVMKVMKAKAKAKVQAKSKAKAKPMKVMKAAMKVSSIATGRKAKAQVYKGAKLKTKTGLKKEDLIKSKTGKIVTAKKS